MNILRSKSPDKFYCKTCGVACDAQCDNCGRYICGEHTRELYEHIDGHLIDTSDVCPDCAELSEGWTTDGIAEADELTEQVYRGEFRIEEL